jgi:hypothetical protein
MYLVMYTGTISRVLWEFGVFGSKVEEQGSEFGRREVHGRL